jgi:hypothetical protein
MTREHHRASLNCKTKVKLISINFVLLFFEDDLDTGVLNEPFMRVLFSSLIRSM